MAHRRFAALLPALALAVGRALAAQASGAIAATVSVVPDSAAQANARIATRLAAAPAPDPHRRQDTPSAAIVADSAVVPGGRRAARQVTVTYW